MSRPLALLFALLLATAGVAAVPAATGSARQPTEVPVGGQTSGVSDARNVATSPPETDPGSVGRMTIDAPDRTGRGTIGPSLSAALSSQANSLQSSHESMTMEKRFETLPAGMRTDFVIAELIETERRVGSLFAKQRRVIERYADGTISEAKLLRTLASIHRTATILDRRLGLFESFTDRLDITYLDARLQRATGLVESMQGPVRELVLERLAATGSLPAVHVEATGRALVLAVLDEGTYVRESVFLENLLFEGDRAITSFVGAISQANQFYPWAGSHLEDDDLSVSSHRILYQVQFPHQHGRLVVSLGTRTGEVFREIQFLDPSKLPTKPVRSVTENGVRVVLNRTYRGGPMRVEVYDADTGERLDADVALGNRTLGTTGVDGRLWFVEPRTAYGVTVDTGTATVTLNVSSSY